MWWRQVAGAGAGAGCRCCELAVHVVEAGCWCWCRVPVLVRELGVHVVETGCWCWSGCRCWWWCCELAVHVVGAGLWCWMHATSYGVVARAFFVYYIALWGIYSSVLAGSCVKGCTVCAHTFLRIMFYAQRQALNRPLFQHVSACYTHNSRAGYCLALGE